MKNKTKKKLYNILDIVWRIIGGILLIFLLYRVIFFDANKITSDIYVLTPIIFILIYIIISAIVFLPPIIIKFVKKILSKKQK